MTIFRLYLMNRLKEGMENTEGKNPRGFIDRRKYKRFSVKDKKILASNKNDLLLINNISKEGLNTETNERTSERLQVGDIYACRIRYREETYICEAKVRWKDKLSVGFSVENPDSAISRFLTRLILPQKIADTLNQVVEEKALKPLGSSMTWHAGEQETHVVTQQIGGYLKWLIKTKEFLLLYDLKEIKAAKEERSLTPELINFYFSSPKNLTLFNPKKDHLTFVEDVIMASELEEKDPLLECLAENKYSEVRLFKVNN